MGRIIYNSNPFKLQLNICLFILLNIIYHKMKINKDLADFYLEKDHLYWQFKQEISTMYNLN